MGTLLGVFHAVFDISVSLDHFFYPKLFDFVTLIGIVETVSSLLSALVGCVYFFLSFYSFNAFILFIIHYL